MNKLTRTCIASSLRRGRASLAATPSRSSALALLAAISSLSASTAFADATWVGGTSQDWNNTANWSATPTGNLTVNNAVAGVFPVISSASTITPVDLFIGNGAGQSGRLDQSTGTLALVNTSTNGNWMFVGTGGGTGAYNLTGDGSLAVGKLWAGGFAFGENGNGTITINTTGSVTANSTDDFSGFGQYNASVLVGWGATGSGTLNLQNGTLNSNGNGMFVGSWGSNGTVNQTGGTINAAALSIAKWFGTGTMNVTNGTVNVTGTVRLAVSGNGGDLMHGTMNVNSGGIVNSGNDFVVAVGGNASSTGNLSVATGGTVNVGTTTERWMMVNQYDTVSGTVDVNGGTINLNGNTDLRFSAGGGTGPGVVNLNSGAITAYSGNQTGAATSSVVDLNQGGGAAANNTFNLNGGTLTTNQVMTNNNNGTATFNFNGGTLKASGDTANFVDLGGAGQIAVVKSGGAVIDSNGFAVTVPQALLDGTGGGGLTKLGAGTLTLSAANTYAGATTISAGTLALASTGSIASGSAIINNGTFDVSAVSGFAIGASQSLSGGGNVIGNVTVNGTLAPGNSPGTMTFANDLTLAGVTTMEIGGATQGTQFDFVNVTGALALGGFLDIVSFGGFNLNQTGTYNLFGASSFSGDFTSVSIGGTLFLVDGGSVWTGGNGLANFSFDATDGVLLVSAIPEPSTSAAILGALALGAVALRRRRT